MTKRQFFSKKRPFSYGTVQNYFGSWNKAMFKALKKSNKKNTNLKRKVKCKNCHKLFLKSRSCRIASVNHFCSRSCSATYNNKHKTYGTRRSKLERYIEIKLKQDFPTLEVIYNGKETIGSELDFYFPSLKLAIELNGILHYEPIYGKDKLGKIQVNDQNKFMMCQFLGISLAIIDSSKLKYFKEKNAEPYYQIVKKLIISSLGRSVLNH